MLRLILKQYRIEVERIRDNGDSKYKINEIELLCDIEKEDNEKLILGKKILQYSIKCYNECNNIDYKKLPYIFISLSLNDPSEIRNIIRINSKDNLSF